MSTLIGGGALAVLAMGQESGSELLDAALSQDPSMGGLLTEAERFVGLGVSPTDAALIVAVTVFGVRLLGWLSPFAHTANDLLRKRFGLDVETPAQD
jgi:hypothetical protein